MVALLAIAANFPGNGGWTVIQCASNFSDSTPSTQHGPNLVMFLSGEVRIAHRATPAWWLECRCWRTSPPTNQWRCASRLNPGYLAPSKIFIAPPASQKCGDQIGRASCRERAYIFAGTVSAH